MVRLYFHYCFRWLVVFAVWFFNLSAMLLRMAFTSLMILM